MAYGKFFDKKSGFISKKWFSYFANYRRDGYDFDALWDEMSTTLDGYGFQDLVKFDTEKYQIELDAKNAVAAE